MQNTVTLKVRGYHLDVYQHVNNARYLEFLEEARWAFFENFDIMRIMQERRLGFAVVRIDISYRRPAFLGDVLEIRTRFGEIGGKSGTMHQTVVRAADGKVIAEAEVTAVILDLVSGKAVELDHEMQHLLAGGEAG